MGQPITPALLQGSFQNFNTRFAQGQKAARVWAPEISMEVPSGTEEEIYAWMHELPTVRKWAKGSARKANRLGANAYRLTNEKYEGTVVVEREKVEDDRLGIYMPMFDSLGRQVAKWPDREIAKLIHANSVCWDGLSFFNTAHVVDPNGDTSITYANDFTTEALTQANFETAYARFASIPSENGEPMGLQPNAIIVPPQLRAKALSIVKAGVIAVTQGSGAAAVTNVNQDLVRVVVIPELASQPTRWHLACTDQGIMPVVFQKREIGSLVARFRDDDPQVFDLDEYIYGVRMRAAFGWSLPYLMSRHTA